MKCLIGLVLSLNATFAMASVGQAIPQNDDYRLLVSGTALSSLDQLSAHGLNFGATKLDLWSGSYWPMYQGSLASRYRTESMRSLHKTSKKYEDFMLLASAWVSTDELSPAEKYDLLIGDTAKTLTMGQLKNGADNRDIGGNVPDWRGICDGWSAATMTWARPVKPVTLKAANGTDITFYPEDIKALGSQLHAKGFKRVTFLGRRCDGSLGHITGACDETNPGTLHLALANRVGAQGKSFVVDASPGKEVWNYPVLKYEFTYSQPLTGVESSEWRAVRLPLVGNENKIYKARSRAKGTVYIVGVTAKVTIMDMRDPNLEIQDDASFDKTLEKVWKYDLELDAQGQVLGGEWHGKNGPDFIWTPREDSLPLSVAETRSQLKFNPEMGVTPALKAAALQASAQAQPLATIVNKLFELAAE